MAHPLLPEINRLIAAKARATVDLIADGGEVTVYGVTIRHYHRQSHNWYIETEQRHGRHAVLVASGADARAAGEAADALATELLARLRAEHKTPDAVHAVLQQIAAMPAVRDYFGNSLRITTRRSGSNILYQLQGSGIQEQVGVSDRNEAELLAILLEPVGCVIQNGEIVHREV